jgi:hypothetical protein
MRHPGDKLSHRVRRTYGGSWAVWLLYGLVALATPAVAVASGAPPDEVKTTRVLAELRVQVNHGDLATAIAGAQRELMTRLTGTRAVVVRQYRSVPLVALEVDADALAKLQHMEDLVIRIVPDVPARTQGGR